MTGTDAEPGELPLKLVSKMKDSASPHSLTDSVSEWTTKNKI